jgi:hypothetical protein
MRAIKLLFVAVVAHAEVVLMEVTAAGTVSSTSLLHAGISGGLANFQIIMGMNAYYTTKTDAGYAIEMTPPSGTTASTLESHLSTCEFRTVLETAWAGDTYGLSDVTITQICVTTSGNSACPNDYATALIACGTTTTTTYDPEPVDESGSGNSSDVTTTSPDEGLDGGTIAGIVIAVLAAVMLAVIAAIGIFASSATGAAAATPIAATASSVTIPLVVSRPA